MKKVLVTGGAGFIGANFLKYMIAGHPDWFFINIDSLTYAGNLENLAQLESNNQYSFIKGDITDRNLLQSIFAEHKLDYVVNFAAESHVDRSIQEPELFLKTNVIGTQCLLDTAKQSWQTDKDGFGYPTYRSGVKFLQISTDEVYGALGKKGLFTEATPLAPNSPYSACKASADLLVRAYSETFKLPVNITRCSNNYGPYQFPEKLIPLMIGNALENKALPVYGDGMQIRDWLHVTDHCSAIDTVLNKGKDGEVYNIGGNNEKTNMQIVELVISKLNRSTDLIEYVADRLGHDRRYAIDNTKITTQLGWKPAYKFAQGMIETIQWYLDNQKWLANVRSGKYLEYYEAYYK